MYSLDDYGKMIADTARMEAYTGALRETVKPGSVVVDIGTGLGLFSILACRFGARRVFAIETDDVIQVARQIAVANGYADRIEFIQNDSSKVTLPGKADLIISDLRGVLPLFQRHLPTIMDARQRLLAEGGVMIAQRDTLWAAIADAPELYNAHALPWTGDPYGIDMSAGRQLLVNDWFKGHVAAEQLLVAPACWATIDYATVDSPNAAAEMTWVAERPGTAHGIVLWFDTLLAEGIQLSNAPGQSKVIYCNAFFPLSEPVLLAAGDEITLKLRADLIGDDYVWCWDTNIKNRDNPVHSKADFRQSTLYGALLSPEHLKKQATGFIPHLEDSGEIDRMILNLMAEQFSLGEISTQLAARFPFRFPTAKQALTRVGELSLKYSCD